MRRSRRETAGRRYQAVHQPVHVAVRVDPSAAAGDAAVAGDQTVVEPGGGLLHAAQAAAGAGEVPQDPAVDQQRRRLVTAGESASTGPLRPVAFDDAADECGG